MLDDLKFIHEKDAQDALGIAERQPQQLEHIFALDEFEKTPGQIKNIVFGGMGGSALAALISQSWPGYAISFEVSRDYTIPSYVSANTLFIASSYSGNTEETIAAMEEAREKGATIVVIASGGAMQELAKTNGYPFVQLPGGLQPRHAALYSLKALVTVLEKAGLLATEKAESELHTASEFLKTAVSGWRADVKTADNPAKQLALELAGSSPVIYSGPVLFPAAYKWKISFNENAKNVAWCNEFPEFNHNEFLGWTSHPTEKPYKIIQLVSTFEHERTQKRFMVTNKLLSGRWPHPHLVEAKGDTLLEQLLYIIALGDFVSIYMALLNGLNPSPVELIETFKKELNN